MTNTRFNFRIILLTAALAAAGFTQAQTLTLKNAIDSALVNYAGIRAKSDYVNASRSAVAQTRKDALPNFIVSAQQDYGTVNGQNGPLYGFGGHGVASSGLPLPAQNWNAAFGALYLANINWDFFAFGRVKEKTNLANTVMERDQSDLQQEIFQHQIKVAAAYLNLVAAQRLTHSQQNNLDRADTVKKVVTTLALNGLIAGVDSSLANAEVSNARILLIRAQDAEAEKANQLALLMGVTPRAFLLDSIFITRIPENATVAASATQHPLLNFYNQRLRTSEQQANYFKKLKYPTFSLFSIFQTRGSGFASTYAADQTAFSRNYINGIKPTRSNYLFGVGVTWNITSLSRINQQVAAQQYISKALQHEYKVVDQQLQAQTELAGIRIKNAIAVYTEVPVQIKAAADAYHQKTTLYKNGLTTIVEVTQTLYTLNRAETDRDVAYSNIWQSLLLKAAATGNFSILLNEM